MAAAFDNGDRQTKGREHVVSVSIMPSNAPGSNAVAGDAGRRLAADLAFRELDLAIDDATRPGFFGRIELIIQDGFVEAVRTERIKKLRRPATS